jgi:hypothetical protein
MVHPKRSGIVCVLALAASLAVACAPASDPRNAVYLAAKAEADRVHGVEAALRSCKQAAAVQDMRRLGQAIADFKNRNRAALVSVGKVYEEGRRKDVYRKLGKPIAVEAIVGGELNTDSCKRFLSEVSQRRHDAKKVELVAAKP